MKRSWGISFAFVFVISAALFSCGLFGVSSGRGGYEDDAMVAAFAYEEGSTPVYSDGYDWHKEFLVGDTTRGIFIIKDKTRDAEYTNSREVFVGDIQIYNGSGDSWEGYEKFSFTPMHWVNGAWQETELFSVEDEYDAAVWRFPKRLPAGKYGVKATALKWNDEYYDEAKLDKIYVPVEELDTATWQMREVNGIYVILYAEELQYINCIYNDKEKGVSVYDAKRYGTGTVSFSVYPNAGAMYMSDLTADAVFHDIYELRGNLLPSDDGMPRDIRLADMKVIIEDPNGAEISLPYAKSADKVTVELPSKLLEGRYTVKLLHHKVSQVYGSFFIDNGYVENYSGGGNSSGGGAFLWVIGLIILLGAAGLFVWPRVQYALQQQKYKKLEENRYAGSAGFGGTRGGSKPASKSRGFWKNLFGPPIPEKPIEPIGRGIGADGGLGADGQGQGAEDGAERTATEVNASRARGFLQKLQDNRAKREIARQAGLTMEEFKEIEDRHKKVDDAKKHSLGDFRRAVEEKATAAITEESEIKEEKNKERNEGEPEFELLESIKKEAPIRESEFAETVVKPNTAQNDASGSSMYSRLKSSVSEQSFAPETSSLEPSAAPKSEPSFESKTEPSSESDSAPKGENGGDTEKEPPKDDKPTTSILSRLRNLTGGGGNA